jgi:hypothetical protein
MESFRFILFCFLPFAGLAQLAPKSDSSKYSPTTSTFSLTFSMFNHAERLMEGQTTYELTDTQLRISNTSFGEKKGKEIFSKKIANNRLSHTIQKLRLDTLKDFYTNWCVMTTSGNEYCLKFSSPQLTKKISLHHYYLKQLDDIIQFINANLPKRHQFQYLTKDQKQDCKL